MRFHSTLEFSEAQQAHAAAYAAIDIDDTKVEKTELDRLSNAEYATLDTLLLDTPALTPTDLGTKLRWYFDREMETWDRGKEYLAAIEDDVRRMQGWPVSPAMLRKWMAWRLLEERWALAGSDEAADEISPSRDQMYAEIGMYSCATPGDFILKQYLRLLTSVGSTLYGQAKDDLTGNMWDIDIDGDALEDATFCRVDQLGCFRDVDNSDVGANLLAYGLPYFDAESWLERADAVGLRVRLIEQRGGGGGLSIGMLDRAHLGVDEDCDVVNGQICNHPVLPRIKRERERLRRILAFRAQVENRTSLIADEIRREWPQLVLRIEPAQPELEASA